MTARATASARSIESVRMIATARSALIRAITDALSGEILASFIAAKCRRLERPAEILEPIETFFNDVDAGGVTEANRTIVAERRARHDRHVRFAEQSIRKILRGQSELADVNQDIKRALRFDRGHVCDFR